MIVYSWNRDQNASAENEAQREKKNSNDIRSNYIYKNTDEMCISFVDKVNVQCETTYILYMECVQFNAILLYHTHISNTKNLILLNLWFLNHKMQFALIYILFELWWDATHHLPYALSTHDYVCSLFGKQSEFQEFAQSWS